MVSGGEPAISARRIDVWLLDSAMVAGKSWCSHPMRGFSAGRMSIFETLAGLFAQALDGVPGGGWNFQRVTRGDNPGRRLALSAVEQKEKGNEVGLVRWRFAKEHGSGYFEKQKDGTWIEFGRTANW